MRFSLTFFSFTVFVGSFILFARLFPRTSVYLFTCSLCLFIYSFAWIKFRWKFRFRFCRRTTNTSDSSGDGESEWAILDVVVGDRMRGRFRHGFKYTRRLGSPAEQGATEKGNREKKRRTCSRSCLLNGSKRVVWRCVRDVPFAICNLIFFAVPCTVAREAIGRNVGSIDHEFSIATYYASIN